MQKLTQEVIIKRFRKKHGNKYNYDFFKYNNARTKDLILCDCGNLFTQLPSAHMGGQGCKPCGNKRSGKTRLKKEKKFIEETIKKHGNKYWYFSKYTGDNIKMQIYCVECQKGFWQKPNDHLQGSGCPDCGRKQCHLSKKLTSEEMLQKAIETHGNKYWYFSPFVDRQIPVQIYCVKCAKGFWQLPAVHLQGSGCVTCANHGGFDPSQPGILYYFKDITNNLFKIGITNRTVKERFSGKNKIIEEIKEWYFAKGADALELEQFLHSELSKQRYDNPNFYGNGSTEFFRNDVLNLENKG